MTTSNTDNSRWQRRQLLRTLCTGGLLTGFGTAGGQSKGHDSDRGESETYDVGVTVKQAPGPVYWSIPGKQRVDPAVFGTPERPRRTVDTVLSEVDDDAVAEVVEQFPFLVGLPMEARETNAEETEYTQTAVPTPFGGDVEKVAGQLDVTYRDRRPYDRPVESERIRDDVSLDIWFTDPDANYYRLDVHRLIDPLVPMRETGGGVITDAWIHGTTGIGTPLLPRVYAYGAFWGLCDVIELGTTVGPGTVIDENKVVHFMTTQNIHKKNHEIALQRELPLDPERTAGGQVHHTHGIVFPITIGDGGPVYEPVQTNYEVEDGPAQSSIYLTFENDSIERPSR